MIHISKGIGVAKAQTYWERDFNSLASNSYYTQQQQVGGVWHGQLAAEMGLVGAVSEKHFALLANGQDPFTEKQLIAHRNTVSQKTGKAMQHRAGHDIVFNPDKSISLTAIHDHRILLAHRAAVNETLAAMEQYVQARGGGNNPHIHTGKWAVATFEHNTARPVDGYSAPHLHTHAFWFNLARDAAGQWRAIQPEQMFTLQKYGSAVYQSRLAQGLRLLGYDIQQGKNHAPVIAGYSEEYLSAESPRSQQIKRKVAELGYSGRRAEEIVAHQYRDSKLDLPPEQIRDMHLARNQEYGNQIESVIVAAALRGVSTERGMSAEEAVTWAKDKITERVDVFRRTELIQESLWAAQQYVTLPEVEKEVDRRMQTAAMRAGEVLGEFTPLFRDHWINDPVTRYTTKDSIVRESRVLTLSREGRSAVAPLEESLTLEAVKTRFQSLNNGAGLNQAQAEAVLDRALCSDRVGGVHGGAGTGKTSSIVVPIQQIALEHGFEVIGVAPTSKARKQLEHEGIQHTMTLQRLLMSSEKSLEKQGIDPEKPRLYFADESSLASTKQYEQFLERLHNSGRPQDRVILVGDARQHESVEAGRIFEELIQGGLSVSSVDTIVRQRSEELRQVIGKLQEGKADRALDRLNEMGSVHVEAKVVPRLDALADAFVHYYSGKGEPLIVSPDNESRQAINSMVREKLQAANRIGADVYRAPVLVARQELTNADRRLASSYQKGDIVQYRKDNAQLGISKGDYATVVSTNTDVANQSVTVEIVRKSAVERITYNPKALSHGRVFEMQRRDLAVGDRIIFRDQWKPKGVANGDMLTLTHVDKYGNLKGKDDRGRVLQWNAKEMLHWDHGYATTSYLSQGVTVDWVFVHLDTAHKSAKTLLTKALAYVAASRSRFGVSVFTDNLDRAKSLLRRSQEKDKALEWEQIQSYAPVNRRIGNEHHFPAPAQQVGTGYSR